MNLPRYLKGLFYESSLAQVEEAEWKFYVEHVKPGMVVFDLGASIGELTLLFSRLVGPQGKVHAFEPTPTSFEPLQFICSRLGRQNVELNQVAVSNTNDLVPLHIFEYPYSNWNSLANRKLDRYSVQPAEPMLVPSVTIDDYCRDRGILKIDLLKIDTEGAEFLVLQGAQRMLREKRIRMCLFEYGQTLFDMGHDPRQLEDFLAKVGYGVRNLIRTKRRFPGKGRESAEFSMHLATPNLW